MFDGFWYGLFEGFLGPSFAQWLNRFKYWTIFLVTTLITQVCFFMIGVKEKGLNEAIKIVFMSGFDPLFFLVPMGIGFLAVFVAFIGSINTPKKPSEDDENKLPR